MRRRLVVSLVGPGPGARITTVLRWIGACDAAREVAGEPPVERPRRLGFRSTAPGARGADGGPHPGTPHGPQSPGRPGLRASLADRITRAPPLTHRPQTCTHESPWWAALDCGPSRAIAVRNASCPFSSIAPGLPIRADQAVDAHAARAPGPPTQGEGLVYRSIGVLEGR